MTTSDPSKNNPAVRAVVDAFVAAYERRDADALKGLIGARALGPKSTISGFVSENLHRGNEMTSMELVVMSDDGRRALAHVGVNRPGDVVRGLRFLLEMTVDARWEVVGVSNESTLDKAFIDGLYDGITEFKSLPLSANLIRRAQRLVDAIGSGGDLEAALGDSGERAKMAIMMLKGQIKSGRYVTVLPAREHPRAARGAIGLSILDPVTKFGSDFWFICHSDEGVFEVLGTSSYVAMGILLGNLAGQAPAARVHAVVEGAPSSLGVGDAFDRAIRKALEDAVAENAQESGVEDAFDRAVRGRMDGDEAAKSRFEALFDQLADDRKDALVQRMMQPSGGVERGAFSLDGLWKNNDFVSVLKQAVADYIAPLSADGEAVNVDADFMAQHGDALVGAVFSAIFRPVAEGLTPEALLGKGPGH